MNEANSDKSVAGPQAQPSERQEQPSPRRVTFLRGLLLYWVMPRRLGPHLANGGIMRALAAQFIAIAFAVALIGFAWVLRSEPHVDSAGKIRIVLAAVVMDLARTSAGWPSILTVLCFAAALLLPPIVSLSIGTLAMPWCADGDDPRNVWRRSVVNALWAFSVFIPATVVVAPVCLAVIRPPTKPQYLSRDFFPWQSRQLPTLDVYGATIIWLISFAFAALLVRCFVTCAGRRAGPGNDAGSVLQNPLCEDCGYSLTGLPLETNCPECGAAVRDSLPGGRRSLSMPRFVGWPGLVEYGRFALAVIFDPSFFRRLSLRNGLTSSRRFFWTTLLACALVGAISALFDKWVFGAEWRFPLLLVQLTVLCIGVPFVEQFAVLFLAGVWGQWRHGIRDWRLSAIVGHFASVMLVLATPFIVTLGAIVMQVLPFQSSRRIPWTTTWIDPYLAALMGSLIVLLFWAGLWWCMICNALRAVRHVNARSGSQFD